MLIQESGCLQLDMIQAYDRFEWPFLFCLPLADH